MPEKNNKVITQDGNATSVDPQKSKLNTENLRRSLDNVNSNHNTNVWKHFIVKDER